MSKPQITILRKPGKWSFPTINGFMPITNSIFASNVGVECIYFYPCPWNAPEVL